MRMSLKLDVTSNRLYILHKELITIHNAYILLHGDSFLLFQIEEYKIYIFIVKQYKSYKLLEFLK